jgi:hypothetical protein
MEFPAGLIFHNALLLFGGEQPLRHPIREQRRDLLVLHVCPQTTLSVRYGPPTEVIP